MDLRRPPPFQAFGGKLSVTAGIVLELLFGCQGLKLAFSLYRNVSAPSLVPVLPFVLPIASSIKSFFNLHKLTFVLSLTSTSSSLARSFSPFSVCCLFRSLSVPTSHQSHLISKSPSSPNFHSLVRPQPAGIRCTIPCPILAPGSQICIPDPYSTRSYRRLSTSISFINLESPSPPSSDVAILR